MKKAIICVAALAASVAPTGVAHAADEQAPCLAEVTSELAVATQGQATRTVAVTEAQAGVIDEVVTTLARTDECPF